jgi:hypothetical protein
METGIVNNAAGAALYYAAGHSPDNSEKPRLRVSTAIRRRSISGALRGGGLVADGGILKLIALPAMMLQFF